MLVCCFFFCAVHHSIVTIFIKYTKGRLCADYLVRVFIQLSTVTKLSNGPIYLWVISDYLFFLYSSWIHALWRSLWHNFLSSQYKYVWCWYHYFFYSFIQIFLPHMARTFDRREKISNLWIVEYKMPFNRISVIITSLIWYMYMVYIL